MERRRPMVRLSLAALVAMMATGAAALPPVRAATSAPVLVPEAPSVVADEGTTATLSGTWSDPDGDDVTITASIGSLHRPFAAVWRWSWYAADGPDATSVTITATDSTGASTAIEIPVEVVNLPPWGWTQGPAFVPVASASSRYFLWTMGDVPGDEAEPTADCGAGTVTGTGESHVVDRFYLRCTFPAAGPYLVGARATDSDGAASDVRIPVTATTAVRSVADGRLVIDGAETWDYAGSALAVADLDDDGRGDIAIGSSAPSYSGIHDDPGIVRVVRGRTGGGRLDLGTLPAGAGWTITGPSGVRFGRALDAAGDVNGDGLDDLVIGSDGTAWVVLGRPGFADLDATAMTAADGFRITGTVGYEPEAASVAGVGDVNGDGYDDVAVGSPNEDTGEGEVAVILGSADPTDVDASDIPAGRGYTIRAIPARTGWDIDGADVNGDGRSDVVVASPFGWYSNALVVYGTAAPVDVDEATMTAGQGFAIGGGQGLNVRAVAAGDMNGDGYAEVALSHSPSDGTGAGVTIVKGAATNAAVPYVGVESGRLISVDTGLAGYSSRLALGDTTGDGKAELVLGIPGARFNDSGAGSAYVLRGGATLADLDLDVLDARWWRVDGDESSARAGSGVAAGDVDGDGVADVVVGAEGGVNWTNVNRGRVAVFAGVRLVDAKPPVVEAPRARIAGTGTVHPLVPVVVRWSATDARSAIVRYDVARQDDGGAWTVVDFDGTATTTTERLAAGHEYRFRVRATDAAGNRSSWAYGPVLRLRGYGDAGGKVAFRRTWTTITSPDWWGGSAGASTASGATATLSFSGRGVAWVAAVGPDRGQARLYIDGRLVRTVDLHAAEAARAVIVFRRSWAASGAHTIRVVVVGTAGRPGIDVDGFVVIR